MYDPRKILTWLDANVQMRRSRKKTLSAIVSGAMRMQGSGVLALGRSMEDTVAAKHRIKRVDRFLGNERVEVDAVSEALFRQFCPGAGPVIVLADWTDRHPFQQLVLAVPCNGRAIPIYWITVAKGDGSGAQEGSMVRAERHALDTLAQFCGDEIVPVIIADRGFGNTRWLSDIQNRGWHFVQRISAEFYAECEHYVGALHELGIRRGWKPRDYGKGTITNAHFGPVRLCAVYDRQAKEPWLLVSNIEGKTPFAIVNLYKKRMWIEAMFRDLKNRQWGLGMDHVRLSNEGRYERHFLILALAYVFLIAFGAVAESAGLGRKLKANTVAERVLNLARIGNYFLQSAAVTIPCAIQAMLDLKTTIKTGDY